MIFILINRIFLFLRQKMETNQQQQMNTYVLINMTLTRSYLKGKCTIRMI